jgi:Fur family ferric uptake transcriptional regulator/Fur family peroxide stress response transcriptional regulator
MTAETVDLRLTPQRRAVLDVLRAATDHPTAAEVFDRVRRVQPGIGSATVYRTLGRLVAAGQALELTLDGQPAARFDANTERHDHLLCHSCGAAADIHAPLADGLLADVAARTGYAGLSYDLVFHGLCPACRASQAPPAP